MAKRKSKAGLLGLSNTTLLLIGGGVALYYLTRPKTENRTMGAIGSTTGKKVFLVYGSEDGVLGIYSNMKYAYERAYSYMDGDVSLSYSQVTKEFKKIHFVTIFEKGREYGGMSVKITEYYINS